MATFDFNTTAEEASHTFSEQIAGKLILITGVSINSIGSEFCTSIIQHSPKLLIIAGRNKDKLQKTKSAIEEKIIDKTSKVECLILDLSDQEQIRKSANEAIQRFKTEKIDVLINSAGVMAVKEFRTTVQDIEMQFGINHIGHFLFTNLVKPILKERGRVLSIASDGYRLSPVRFEDISFQEGKTYDKWKAYGQSKTANMLFIMEFSKRNAGKFTGISLHPGAIHTNLGSHLSVEDFEELRNQDEQGGFLNKAFGLKFKSLQQGAATYVRAAFDPTLDAHSGSYMEDCQVVPPQKIYSWGRDAVNAEMLWTLSERLVNKQFPSN